MSFNISYIFEAQDRFSKTARAISKSLKNVTDNADKLNGRLEKLHRSITGFGMGVSARLGAPITALGIASLKASSSVEVWRTQWEVYTHSAKKAKEMTQSLINWAKTTPFRIPDIEKAGLILAALNVPLKDIPGDLKSLGNISALTNQPMSTLAMNFGKVHAATRLTSFELLELRRIGVAVIPQFADLLKKLKIPPITLEEAVKQRKVQAKDFDKLIAFMASKQGKYGEGTKKLSKTLKGMYTTVLDNMFLVKQAIGDQIVSITNLHSHVVTLNKVMTKFTDTLKPWIAAHKHIALMAFEVGAVLALLGPTLIVIGQIAWAVWGLSKAFGVVLLTVRAIISASMFLFLTPIGWIILALIAISALTVMILHHFYTWGQMGKGLVATFNVLKKIFEYIAKALQKLWLPFKIMRSVATQLGGVLYKHLLSPIDEAHKKLGPLMDRMTARGGGKIFGVHGYQPAAVANKHITQSNLAISLYDPGRFIKAVTGQSTGNMTFDTGTNMMLSRI